LFFHGRPLWISPAEVRAPRPCPAPGCRHTIQFGCSRTLTFEQVIEVVGPRRRRADRRLRASGLVAELHFRGSGAGCVRPGRRNTSPNPAARFFAGSASKVYPIGGGAVPLRQTPGRVARRPSWVLAGPGPFADVARCGAGVGPAFGQRARSWVQQVFVRPSLAQSRNPAGVFDER